MGFDSHGDIEFRSTVISMYKYRGIWMEIKSILDGWKSETDTRTLFG